jgi:aldose 1-epimerase
MVEIKTRLNEKPYEFAYLAPGVRARARDSLFLLSCGLGTDEWRLETDWTRGEVMSHSKYLLCLSAISFAVALGAAAQNSQPGIKMTIFGKMPDGQEVHLFTLTNRSGMQVALTNYGARIVSIDVPDKNGKMADVVLGFDDLAGYLGKDPYFGATVGRYANRIANGKFSLDSVQYKLPINDGPNSLHGGMQGFDKKVWTAREVSQ